MDFRQIPVIITTFNRAAYFKRMWDSLQQSECKDNLIFVYDDCSFEPGKKSVLPVDTVVRECTLGTTLNTMTAIHDVFTSLKDCKFLLVLQDDIIVSKNFLSSALKIWDKICEPNIAMLSLFNRAPIKTIQMCYKYTNDYFILKLGHAGGVACLFAYDFLECYFQNFPNVETDYLTENTIEYKKKHEVDYKLALRIHAMSFDIAVCQQSLVQHLGDQSSLHSRDMTFCRSKNFVGAQ
jgi:hypothetical protein